MAFFNEFIQDDARSSFDFKIFQSFFNGFHKFEDWELNRWAIDRERNAQFLYVESAGGAHVNSVRISRYALRWDGAITYFDSECDVVYERNDPPVLTWFNSKIIVARNLHERTDVVVSLILEAVHAMGWGFSTDLNPKVVIKGQPTVVLTTEF